MANDDGMKLGHQRAFTDPVTGEVITEAPVLLPATTQRRGGGGLQERAPEPGFAVVNMDALWLLRLAVKSAATIVVLLEAARQKRMNGGGVKLTSTFCARHAITRRQSRTVVDELAALESASGWVTVSRTRHSSARIEVTDLGMRQLWHAGRG
jgi:hypothetical protein